jgi:hypothetical protein
MLERSSGHTLSMVGCVLVDQLSCRLLSVKREIDLGIFHLLDSFKELLVVSRVIENDSLMSRCRAHYV